MAVTKNRGDAGFQEGNLNEMVLTPPATKSAPICDLILRLTCFPNLVSCRSSLFALKGRHPGRSTVATQRRQKEGPDHYRGTSKNHSHHHGPGQMQ